MIVVADSDTVIKHLRDGVGVPAGDLIVPDDLYEEYLVAEERHGKRLKNVKKASDLIDYDRAYYLRVYADTLNAYAQVSLARMSGLGDVSILALLRCIVENFGNEHVQLSLDLDGGPSIMASVITNDGQLRKKIKTEFGNDDIKVVGHDDPEV